MRKVELSLQERRRGRKRPALVLISDLDKIKEIAVECMKVYITQLNLTDADKEELKQNRECWADMVLKGIKQRLYESGKLK